MSSESTCACTSKGTFQQQGEQLPCGVDAVPAVISMPWSQSAANNPERPVDVARTPLVTSPAVGGRVTLFHPRRPWGGYLGSSHHVPVDSCHWLN